MSVRRLCALLVIAIVIPKCNGTCFTRTYWTRFMEVLVSEKWAKMTENLCAEGCLSLAKCTGYQFGVNCTLFGKLFNYGMEGCTAFETYMTRTPSCTNPASNVTLKVADAAGKQISFIYEIWGDKYTYANKTVAGFASIAAATNVKYAYETQYETKYLHRTSNARDSSLNYVIDFPAEQVASISIFTSATALFQTGAFVQMQACSWTNCEDVQSKVTTVLSPASGSILSTPFRLSIKMGTGSVANPQIFRWKYDPANPAMKNLEIIFNLK